MSRKQKAVEKKVKPNLNKPPVRPVLHINYLRVYHEVLKFEEVMDIELDKIFNKTMDVIQSHIESGKMGQEPHDDFIDDLVFEIIDQLKKKAA